MDLSVLGVFSAGLLTFLSPCVLPLMPILLASLLMETSAEGGQGSGRVALASGQRIAVALWFVAGFSTVFVLMGLSIPGLASLLGGSKALLLGAAGVLLAVFGLKMMNVLPGGRLLDWLNRSAHLPDFARKLRERVPRGVYGLLFGSIFGLSWTPCVGPVLGGVLTYVASREASPAQGALWLFVFSLGIGLPVVLLAWASDRALPWMSRLKEHLPKLEYAIGLGLFAFGIYMLGQARLQPSAAVQTASSRSPVTAVDATGTSVVLNSESNRRARVVFFHSENCPICHAMEKYLPDLETECSRQGFELVRVNVDEPRNSVASRAFSVKAVPTVSVLNDRGDEVVHLVGYQTQARLMEALNTTSKLACNAVPLPTLIQEPAPDKTCGPVTGDC